MQRTGGKKLYQKKQNAFRTVESIPDQSLILLLLMKSNYVRLERAPFSEKVLVEKEKRNNVFGVIYGKYFEKNIS